MYIGPGVGVFQIEPAAPVRASIFVQTGPKHDFHSIHQVLHNIFAENDVPRRSNQCSDLLHVCLYSLHHGFFQPTSLQTWLPRLSPPPTTPQTRAVLVKEQIEPASPLLPLPRRILPSARYASPPSPCRRFCYLTPCPSSTSYPSRVERSKGVYERGLHVCEEGRGLFACPICPFSLPGVNDAHFRLVCGGKGGRA